MHVLGSRLAGARQGVSNIKIVKNLPIHLGSAQKPIYSDGIHLKLTVWPKWSKSPKSPRAHFPLGFRGENFQKIYRSKLHQKTL